MEFNKDEKKAEGRLFAQKKYTVRGMQGDIIEENEGYDQMILHTLNPEIQRTRKGVYIKL